MPNSVWQHLALVFAGAACFATGGCSKRAAAPCTGCNVVLISMDTVRADHLGVYGYARDTSPNVDRFARQAAVFENAISQSAWTLPAHASMMTGLSPSRLGVSHYPTTNALPEVPMLADQFRRAGYATGAFTGGGLVAAEYGFARGFDVSSSDGRRFDDNMEKALSWLAQQGKRKFFLFLHGYDAHRPYFSLAEDKAAVGLTGTREAPRPGYCTLTDRKQPADLGVVVQYYDASIHHGDREIGRFLSGLESLGLSQHTVVLITSDHGEEFFEHGNCDHVRFLYREIVHVPFLLRVPGHASAGTRFPDPVPASLTVARTLLELVGIDAPEFPGESLLPVLAGKPSPFAAVYSETDSERGRLGSRGKTIAMTTRERKLISYLDEGKDEAYDAIHDSGEQVPLPSDDAVYLQHDKLVAWKHSIESVEPNQKRSAHDEIPPEVKKQLEALGYLQDAL